MTWIAISFDGLLPSLPIAIGMERGRGII